MDKFIKILIPIVFLLVAIPLIDGNGINAKSTNAHNYSENGIYFEYPDSWQQLNQIDAPNALIAFGDPSSTDQLTGTVNTHVIIQKAPISSETTLKQSYDSNYAGLMTQDSSFKTISENLAKVDGTLAYVNIHTINVNGVEKQYKAVWFEKKGNIYVILCEALPDAFAAQQTKFDEIINSFKVE